MAHRKTLLSVALADSWGVNITKPLGRFEATNVMSLNLELGRDAYSW